MVSAWTYVKSMLPLDNSEVEVVTPSGDQRTLIYRSRLWWLPDNSMYVYFTPVMWRYK